MESLLCNEVWPMSPTVVQESNGATDIDDVLIADEDYCNYSYYCEQDFCNFTDKEGRYIPEPGYINLLVTNDLMRDSRFKAVNWLVKSQKRLNLSLGTVFIAVNNLDRFVSLSQCKGWKDWMFELLSIACLSVASKFNETMIFPLSEFQGDGLNHSFAPNLIQRMELTLLKGLGWTMASKTSISYTQLLIRSSIDGCNKTLVEENLGIRVTQLLVTTLLDPKFLEFEPYIVAISAVRCVFGDPFSPKRNASVFPETVLCQDQKDDLSKCQRSMRELQDNNIILACGNSWNGPSSPVTVLLKDYQVDACLLMNIDKNSLRKRKREDEEEEECGI